MNKVFSLAVLSALLMSCAVTESAGLDLSETVKLGVIAPMSGDAAAFGEEQKHVLDYAVAQKNSEGGVQYELVYEDGQCNGPEAVTAFQKLVDVDGVDFILGGLCSSESLAIAPLLESSGVIAMSSLSSSPELANVSPNFISFSYSDSAVGIGIADELKQFETVAIITEQNDYNTALTDVVVAELEGAGVEIVYNEEFEKGETQFRSMIQELKAAGADAILFNPNLGVSAESLVRQMAEVSEWQPHLVGGIVLKMPSIIEIAPEFLEGSVAIDVDTLESPAFMAIYDEINADYGNTTNIGSFYVGATLDAFLVMTELIEEFEGNTEEMKTALRSRTFSVNTGEIFFGDQTFSQSNSTSRFVIQSGRAVKSNQ